MWLSNFVVNQKGTPAIISDVIANIPLPGVPYRLFVATDTFNIYQDDGSAWNLLTSGSSSIQSVNHDILTDGPTTTVASIIGANSVLIAARGTSVIDTVIYTGTPTGNSILVNLSNGLVTAPADQEFNTGETLLFVIK